MFSGTFPDIPEMCCLLLITELLTSMTGLRHWWSIYSDKTIMWTDRYISSSRFRIHLPQGWILVAESGILSTVRSLCRWCSEYSPGTKIGRQKRATCMWWDELIITRIGFDVKRGHDWEEPSPWKQKAVKLLEEAAKWLHFGLPKLNLLTR